MSHETASAGVDERLVLETAMDAGHILLENGAEIFRVEETMDRICRYFGVGVVFIAYHRLWGGAML